MPFGRCRIRTGRPCASSSWAAGCSLAATWSGESRTWPAPPRRSGSSGRRPRWRGLPRSAPGAARGVGAIPGPPPRAARLNPFASRHMRISHRARQRLAIMHAGTGNAAPGAWRHGRGGGTRCIRRTHGSCGPGKRDVREAAGAADRSFARSSRRGGGRGRGHPPDERLAARGAALGAGWPLAPPTPAAAPAGAALRRTGRGGRRIPRPGRRRWKSAGPRRWHRLQLLARWGLAAWRPRPCLAGTGRGLRRRRQRPHRPGASASGQEPRRLRARRRQRVVRERPLRARAGVHGRPRQAGRADHRAGRGRRQAASARRLDRARRGSPLRGHGRGGRSRSPAAQPLGGERRAAPARGGRRPSTVPGPHRSLRVPGNALLLRTAEPRRSPRRRGAVGEREHGGGGRLHAGARGGVRVPAGAGRGVDAAADDLTGRLGRVLLRLARRAL